MNPLQYRHAPATVAEPEGRNVILGILNEHIVEARELPIVEHVRVAREQGLDFSDIGCGQDVGLSVTAMNNVLATATAASFPTDVLRCL